MQFLQVSYCKRLIFKHRDATPCQIRVIDLVWLFPQTQFRNCASCVHTILLFLFMCITVIPVCSLCVDLPLFRQQAFLRSLLHFADYIRKHDPYLPNPEYERFDLRDWK